MFIRLRELTSASGQSMAHIAISVNLYTRIGAVRPSTSNVVHNDFGHFYQSTSLFPNPLMNRIHIWSDVMYWSKVFLSTIPTPTHGLKVKVTDLEVYS